MFGENKQKKDAAAWNSTKAHIQVLIGKADEDLTTEELVDAVLENAKSQNG